MEIGNSPDIKVEMLECVLVRLAQFDNPVYIFKTPDGRCRIEIAVRSTSVGRQNVFLEVGRRYVLNRTSSTRVVVFERGGKLRITRLRT